MQVKSPAGTNPAAIGRGKLDAHKVAGGDITRVGFIISGSAICITASTIGRINVATAAENAPVVSHTRLIRLHAQDRIAINVIKGVRWGDII